MDHPALAIIVLGCIDAAFFFAGWFIRRWWARRRWALTGVTTMAVGSRDSVNFEPGMIVQMGDGKEEVIRPRPNLDAIEKRLEAVTPWDRVIKYNGGEMMLHKELLQWPARVVKADADLIAHAPTDLRELVDWCKELERENARRFNLDRLYKLHESDVERDKDPNA